MASSIQDQYMEMLMNQQQGQAAGQGVQGAMGLGLGLWQMIQSAKYANTQRPTMGIPQGLTNAENIYKQQAYGSMSGLDNQIQQLLGNEATSFNRAKGVSNSPAALMGLSANLNQGTNRNLMNLMDKNSAYQTEGQNRLAGFEGSTMANAQQNQWNWNQKDPYERAMYASSMLQEGGLQNTSKGVGSAGSAAFNLLPLLM
jgi:hypothetical protein